MKNGSKYLFFYPLIIFWGAILYSCTNSTRSETSPKHLWLDSLEIDAMSGATTMGEYSDSNWQTPIYKIKKYLASNGFIIDTTRLNQLDSNAYVDLRKSSFKKGENGLVNILNKELHTVGENSVLINGTGYYFAKCDSTGSFPGIDLGFEHWKFSGSSVNQIIELMENWKNKYYPMPIYIGIDKDNLYALYTRSVQFDPFLKSCIEELERK